MADVGELNGEPNEKHGDKSENKDDDAEENVEEALDVTRVAVERRSVDTEGGSVADEFEFAELGGECRF